MISRYTLAGNTARHGLAVVDALQDLPVGTDFGTAYLQVVPLFILNFVVKWNKHRDNR